MGTQAREASGTQNNGSSFPEGDVSFWWFPITFLQDITKQWFSSKGSETPAVLHLQTMVREEALMQSNLFIHAWVNLAWLLGVCDIQHIGLSTVLVLLIDLKWYSVAHRH